MEGKASIQIGNVNNIDKQKVSLTYYLGPMDSVEEAQEIKYALDTIAEAYGAEVKNEAIIIGEKEDIAASEKASAKVETVKDKIEK